MYKLYEIPIGTKRIYIYVEGGNSSLSHDEIKRVIAHLRALMGDFDNSPKEIEPPRSGFGF